MTIGPDRDRGFTLIELIVALAIFAVLMSGILMLFVGSLRATQTGYQQMDAFERARGALTAFQNDLVSGFSSQQTADVRNFYGTPIGFMMVGIARSTSNASDMNIARITYVVYNQMQDGVDPFPEALEHEWKDVNNNVQTVMVAGYPYRLLRYVEPGIGDLDTYPFSMDDPLPVQQGSMAYTYQQVLDKLCGPLDPALSTEQQQEIIRAKTREMWIRMLAGGDKEVPVNYWIHVLPLLLKNTDKLNGVTVFPPFSVYEDRAKADNFTIAENVLSIASPDDRQEDPMGLSGYAFTSFLDYDMDSAYSQTNFGKCTDPVTDVPIKCPSWWWNDPLNKDYWLEFRLPEEVEMNLWLMFVSPYVGAPDFKRQFSLRVAVPAAYTRGGQLGVLQVLITPPAAVTDGAKWMLDGGPEEMAGAIIPVAVGTHTVSFKDITNWTTPPSQTVKIGSPNDSQKVAGAYS